jgi:DUF1365 family protein
MNVAVALLAVLPIDLCSGISWESLRLWARRARPIAGGEGIGHLAGDL